MDQEQGKYFTTIPRCLGRGTRSIGSSCSRSSDEENATTGDHSAALKWRSSNEQGFHKHSPLVAQRNLRCKELTDTPQRPQPYSIAEEMDALNMAMARTYQLPKTGYFSNNHIMVNGVRAKHVVPALSRNSNLDTLARWHAEAMAASERIFHSDPGEINLKLKKPSRRIGENVAVGETVSDIHGQMMTKKKGDYNNIIDRRYTEMGMGTAKGRNGELYLCQIFRG